MPNWCNNTLRVLGLEGDVRRFKETAIGNSPWLTLTFLLDYEEISMGFKGLAKIRGDAVEDHCVEL